jgi:hypothetical protein
LRDVNTICRRSWYIAAHVWKIYDFKIEVVPMRIVFLEKFSKSQNRLWLKLDKSFFLLKDDLYICGVYIPPKNSPHYNKEYEGLELEISTVLSKGKIIVNGRF